MAALVAAGIYASALQRVDVVVAARDLGADRALEVADLETRALPPDAVPAGAVRDASLAIGGQLRVGLSAGQFVMRRDLGASAAFASGIETPAGTRAVALPVTPAQAVGGSLLPGLRIDVVAVPVSGRAPVGRTTELLAVRALILDVRTESGAPLTRGRASGAIAPERLGSVVVAVPGADALRVADRVATSTFVLLLATER